MYVVFEGSILIVALNIIHWSSTNNNIGTFCITPPRSPFFPSPETKLPYIIAVTLQVLELGLPIMLHVETYINQNNCIVNPGLW